MGGTPKSVAQFEEAHCELLNRHDDQSKSSGKIRQLPLWDEPNTANTVFRASHLLATLSRNWLDSMKNGILIADDSGRARSTIRAYLARNNLSVCGEAVDGRDAIEKAQELDPALILLDLSMPQMNGVEVASVLKARLPDLRIVLLTMFTEAKYWESLMSKVGIDAVISKPEGLSELAGCIRRLLSTQNQKSFSQTP